ncbi:MAG TPA: GNAT family N-acetyltransferase, partial [Candidatus Saccharicenans sp.]|nr:GNAT family N-acetyltransferase [Candidatus Saccharicenans sp.]HRT26418.1 GNAT family N-acetyltransferase [Candidatus Saccharicenans sp.]
TPVHQFCISTFMGGIVLGAWVDGELAGFVYSFPAIFRGRFCHHSHLLAVLPEYRGYGLGKRLKWAQRREVLKIGLDVVTWTYDPMQSRNANLNLHTLGGICRTYLPDFYGETPSLRLGPGIPADRLLVEWPIKTARVEQKARGTKEPPLEPDSYPKVLEGQLAPNGQYLPGKPHLRLKKPIILAETVREVEALRPTPEVIAAWQAALRQVFKHYFQQGYAVVDFSFGEKCYYVLSNRLKNIVPEEGGARKKALKKS